MSGILNGRFRSQGQWWRGGRVGRGRGATIINYYSGSTTKHKGLCFALGKHIFD